MPKLGMEPIRRTALVKATIAEIGRAGSLEVTVSQIAKRAGVSSALAHHYFGRKDQLLLAAMRHILSEYSGKVRTGLKNVRTPRARLDVIIRASFEVGNFEPEVISAWLNFYVQAHSMEGAQRLLLIYQSRLNSNLVSALRPLIGADSVYLAEDLAALIDGVYIRQALSDTAPDGDAASKRVLAFLDLCLGNKSERTT